MIDDGTAIDSKQTFKITPVGDEIPVEGKLIVGDGLPVEGNGLKRMWNRRFKSVMIWLLTCIGLIAGTRYLQLDKELVKLIIEKSTWILGVLIIGLSGTDLMRDWIEKYK